MTPIQQHHAALAAFRIGWTVGNVTVPLDEALWDAFAGVPREYYPMISDNFLSGMYYGQREWVELFDTGGTDLNSDLSVRRELYDVAGGVRANNTDSAVFHVVTPWGAILSSSLDEYKRWSHEWLYEGDLETDFLRILGQVQEAARALPVGVEIDFRV